MGKRGAEKAQNEPESKRVSHLSHVFDNVALRSFYKEQLGLSKEDEDELIDSFGQRLPRHFRLNTSVLGSDFRDELRTFQDSGFIERTFTSTGLPGHVDSWRVLKKEGISKKLVIENDAGVITFQEMVSMLPPMLMSSAASPDLGYRCLDLCAAPGSKTNQLADSLVRPKTLNPMSSESHVTCGLGINGSAALVANDANAQRVKTLIHQVNRCPAPHVAFTQLDGSNYPGKDCLFDRIMADVPCSGDGTFRKAPDLWRKWTPKLGKGSHCLQLRILRRGLKLLAPGGILSYSTCSMNPIENEAVVAAALAETEGIELLDAHNELEKVAPHFKARKGLLTWKVPTDPELFEAGHMWIKLEDADGDQKIAKSWFPPTSKNTPKLERCVRVLPQDNDSGAFFVALFTKTIGSRREVDPDELAATINESDPFPKAGGVFNQSWHEVPDSSIASFCQYFGLSENVLPDIYKHPPLRPSSGVGKEGGTNEAAAAAWRELRSKTQFLRKRCTPDRLYLVTKEIGALVTRRGATNSPKEYSAVGVHALESMGEGRWRMCDDAAHFLGPCVQRRRLTVGPATAAILTGGTHKTSHEVVRRLREVGDIIGCSDAGLVVIIVDMRMQWADIAETKDMRAKLMTVAQGSSPTFPAIISNKGDIDLYLSKPWRNQVRAMIAETV